MPQDIITMAPRSLYPVRPSEETVGWKATKQFFFVIFKWQRLILSLFLAFTVAALAAMYLRPPVRAATAKIMLKADRTPLMIAGLSNLSSRFAFAPQIMQTEVEMIRGREVLLPVAKKLFSINGREEKGLQDSEIEAMLSSLSSNTVAVAVPETNVIQVTHFAQTSEGAERNLSLITDQYLERQADIQSGSFKLLKFYEQEKERVGTQLREAEDKLKEWQGKNQTVSIDEQISTQIKSLADRENALQQTEAQLEVTRAKIAVLRSQLSQLPEREVMSRTQVRNPAATKLQSDLVAAEVALQDLLLRYTEKDRRVHEKRKQIAILKKELADAEKEEIVGSETIGLNPMRRSLEQELAAAHSSLSSLASQKEAVTKHIRENSAALASLREKKVDIDRLSREVDLHRNAFMLYGKQFEEARVATGLGKEQLGNIALIERPHAVPFTKDFQKRIGLVFLAAFVGLALGMAIAFGFEFFNNSLRTQEDVEHYLGVPVLAAIPDLPNRPVALMSQDESEM
jgi:uncharacterized protein involved in exopolysaccharide biosynthesis